VNTIKQATEDEFVYHWLRSEAHKVAGRVGGRKQQLDELVADDANLDDSAANHQRLVLLCTERLPLLLTLPLPRTLEFVEVEASDIDDLRIIPCDDWYLDTGRTFELRAASTHLGDGKFVQRTSGREVIDHRSSVDAKLAYLRTRSVDNEYLILLTRDGGPPYTILDGTHRATAFLRAPIPPPWNAILISSPAMDDCQWYFGGKATAALIHMFDQMIENGLLG
jgi:hypothetical protein